MTYLRGFIKPGYPNGIHSQLRELVLCRSVLRLEHGESLEAAAGASMGLMLKFPFKDTNQLLAAHNEILKTMAIAHDLMHQHPPNHSEGVMQDAQASKQTQLEQLAAMLKALNESDAKDKLRLD